MIVSNARGILRALLRDTRANTLVIMAASLIPLAAMVGGGLDMSRLYLAKTRLQQACDAGALGGRKVMGGGTWPGTNNAASNAATNFFNANFQAGAYGTGTLLSNFTENSGKVSGTASVVVPMTLMRIFRMPSQTLTVVCEADMRLPNTDVMFVLDTTGSMAQPAPGGTQAKIDVLHDAVKCFYEKLARLDTDADCGPAPSGGVGADIQVRFGFMPYATNVNVGKLLPTSYFPDNWYYQSRTFKGYQWSAYTDYSYAALNKSGGCDDVPDTSVAQYNVSKQKYGSTYYCLIQRSTKDAVWTYDRIQQSIAGLKSGTRWNSTLTVQKLNDDGTDKTITWDGCIEERQTTRTTNYSPIPAAAKDLNIDLPPNSSDSTTQWGPALPGMLYTRDEKSSGGAWDINAANSTTDKYANSSYYACPNEARKLQTWTPADFDAYVDALTPEGNTYHDIGMLWGARFISKNGIFKSENTVTPKGGKIQRNIIFMTDGDTQASPTDYAAYGIHWFDRRETDASVAPTQAKIEEQINLRFAAICSAVKNMGSGDDQVVIWVISFGDGVADPATKARLQACATDTDHFFPARSAADLKSAFESIANRISQLRLTQ